MKRQDFAHTRLRALAAILILACGFPAAGKTKFKVLHNFTGSIDGGNPILFAPLAADKQSNLYGATYRGGTGCGGVGCGVVFRTARGADGKWSDSVLFDLADTQGGFDSPLALDSQGNLYGCTKGSGNTTFQLTPGFPQWNFNAILPSGCLGPVGLLFDGKGNFYGDDIDEISPTANGWVDTNLYTPCQQKGCPDGYDPLAPFSWDSKGNLYGTTYAGGYPYPGCNCGVVFQLTPNGNGTWTYHVMHRFTYGDDGCSPYGGLTVDAGGIAYGTAGCGPTRHGVVFKMTQTGKNRWKETVLYDFGNGNHGFGPESDLVLDGAGNIYGIANSNACGGLCGLVYELAPQKGGKWKYSVLHQFGMTDGDIPNGVTTDSEGRLYGTTMFGGKYGYGVVWQITP
jgi:uncharacterized repeat protein (TIGR03803 family)